MSETSNETGNETQPADEQSLEEERRKIAEVDRALEEKAEGDGLAAEADRAEPNGISEG